MRKIAIAATFLFLLMSATEASAQHTVKKGDTLWKIANFYGMAYSRLIELNPQINNPNQIYIGQYIHINDGTKADQVVEYAEAIAPKTIYFWGGNDFTGTIYTDCSGWTKHIYERFGVVLPRVSWEQARTGYPVRFEQLKKGDLMFFGDNGQVSHVGIFKGYDANGTGWWISNLGTGKNVQTFSLNGSWTQSRFLWGARVL
jgi:cell wall-associated NlpC family hydrolase